jgi:Zn-dependent protease
MIDEVIWFVAGCWAAGLVLGACKLDKPVIALACGGIPFHELSHLAACLALGVRVRSITLLRVDEAGAGGNVEPRDEIRNPFTALVVSLAPAVGAVFWTMLFAWGVAAVSDLGYDQAWTWLLLYLAVATGT